MQRSQFAVHLYLPKEKASLLSTSILRQTHSRMDTHNELKVTVKFLENEDGLVGVEGQPSLYNESSRLYLPLPSEKKCVSFFHTTK